MIKNRIIENTFEKIKSSYFNMQKIRLINQPSPERYEKDQLKLC